MTDLLRFLDVIGVYHFVYGGDPEWERRRWFMVVSMTFNGALMVGSLISAALGRMPVELAQTVVTSGFALIMVVVPGYVGLAVWDAKNKLAAGATTEVTTTTEDDPPGTTTQTVKQSGPGAADPPALVPATGAGE